MQAMFNWFFLSFVVNIWTQRTSDNNKDISLRICTIRKVSENLLTLSFYHKVEA